MKYRPHRTSRATCLVLFFFMANTHGETLPPPPASPAPVLQLEYDAQGNAKRSILGPGNSNFNTSHDYDRLHRRFKTTDARNKDTWLHYNGRADLIQVADPERSSLSTQETGSGMSLVSPVPIPERLRTLLTQQATWRLGSTAEGFWQPTPTTRSIG